MSTKKQEPFKIILCSGPRGGKSVIARKITEWFSNEYKVYIIAETARELFDAGLIYENSPYEAQKAIIQKQLLKEKELFEKIYLNSSLDRTIVVFDRTCIDAGTFLSPDEYARLLNELNLTKDDIAMYLHGSFVIHMQSMAVTQPEYYDKRNQLSSVLRRESAAEAAASDEKIFLAYEKYKDIFKKHIMIEATDKIEDKSAAVKNAISEFIKFSSKSSY